MSRAAERLIEADQEYRGLMAITRDRFMASGRRWFAAGRKRAECPLTPRSAAWSWWMEGYREAEEQQEAK